jgi:hypothetical protein
MSVINHEKTPEILQQMKDINMSAVDIHTCIKALGKEKMILMLLVDTMPMDYIEKVIQHKKEDWG